MRRGRIHLVKILIGALIVLAVFYYFFSDSKAHTRAKEAISARFTRAGKFKIRDRPVFVKGNFVHHLIFINHLKHFVVFFFNQSLEIMNQNM